MICIEQIVADALDNVSAPEHVPNNKNKAKRTTAKGNCVDGAAIQPLIVKSITVACH